MTKIRKIIAGFVGSMLIGSASSAANSTPTKGKVESKIHNIIRALHAKKIQTEQSKRIFEYLEKNYPVNSPDLSGTNKEAPQINSGNWDNWNNWSTWENWNNWSTWENWNNWSNY
ncbi:MAG TPA: hypothetical protein VG847_04575 [Chitinophagaceae bacterium]|nr:hypothetical protein [Chitinophagaceae bacterium]